MKHFSDWHEAQLVNCFISFKTQAFLLALLKIRWNFSLMGNREASASTGQRLPGGSSSLSLFTEDRQHAFLKTEYLKGLWNKARAALWQPNWQSQGHVIFWKLMSFQVSCAWLSQVTMKRGSNSDFNDMPQGALRTTAIFILDSAGPQWTKGGKSAE